MHQILPRPLRPESSPVGYPHLPAFPSIHSKSCPPPPAILLYPEVPPPTPDSLSSFPPSPPENLDATPPPEGRVHYPPRAPLCQGLSIPCRKVTIPQYHITVFGSGSTWERGLEGCAGRVGPSCRETARGRAIVGGGGGCSGCLNCVRDFLR